jgi:hypothetical protein
MKTKINFTLNFGYDSKTNDFNINGSLSLDGDFDSRNQNYVDYDDFEAIEYNEDEE